MMLSRSLPFWPIFLFALPMAFGGTGSITIQVRDGDGKPVEEAAAWAIPVEPGAEFPAPGEASIDQIDREFVPFVSIVQVGTAVSFPNRDDIRHHVYSFSEPKRFELPLYKGTPSKAVVFDNPGIVTLGCNIHDWMMAYVVVVETPFFAVADLNGMGNISSLPPGDYVVELWHPRLRAESEVYRRNITVGAKREILLEYEVDLRPGWRTFRGGRRGGGYR